MVISSDLASRFIGQYKDFLLYVYHEVLNEDKRKDFIAREYYVSNHTLLDQFVDITDDIDLEMIDAIKSLRLDMWVYLRDTTKYSLFINPQISQSFAVLGLNDPIKHLFGSSGLTIKTGVCCMDNKYVCDGLISSVVQMGKNYKSEFNEMYKRHKAEGMFYTKSA